MGAIQKFIALYDPQQASHRDASEQQRPARDWLHVDGHGLAEWQHSPSVAPEAPSSPATATEALEAPEAPEAPEAASEAPETASGAPVTPSEPEQPLDYQEAWECLRWRGLPPQLGRRPDQAVLGFLYRTSIRLVRRA